jgi:hypothetical protein
MITEIGRRSALCLPLLLGACGRRDGERCENCGMAIDPHSPWTALLLLPNGGKVSFDSPRCALLAWRSGRVPAEGIRVQDYYDRGWKDGAEVRFIASSDVQGPMGGDLVPVDTGRAPQFAREHTGTRPLPLEAVTLALLQELR